jgi:aspartate aminotransferase-like enzyme
MEMAVRSGVRRRALCLIGGAYGERFAGITEAVGKDVVRLNVPLGRTIEPDMLEDALKRCAVDAVTLVHSETSTGALAPLEELAAVTGEFDDVLLLVDGATSVGASPVETDLWGLDYLFTGSHGALALPPGLALAVASERLRERAKSIPERGACFDIVAFQEAAEAFQPTFTPAIPLLFGLEQQLLRIEDSGGVAARWDRHEAMREAVEWWVEEHGKGIGFGLLPESGRRSWAVSCLSVPDGINARRLTKALELDGFSVGSGYGKLKRTTLRIGHMGDHSVEELRDLLVALGSLVTGAYSKRPDC